MKKLLLGFLFATALVASAQNTTVSGTVTDPDNLTWNNGNITFAIYNPFGGQVTLNGTPLTPAQSNPVLTMNASGAFSGSVLDNNQLQPTGTQWVPTVCPVASAACQQLQRVTITGTSQDLTTTINSQLKALRFPAGYTARAYGPVEIFPIPPIGATYFDLNLKYPLYWTGTAWVGFGSNTGITPHTPANSVQLANNDVTAFNSDANFLFDPVAHTLIDKANAHFNAFQSTPMNIYDPMDTMYDGGLAAAMAGTSGFTPTQVIQAAMDYGECQFLQGLAPQHMRIPLPNFLTIPIGQLLLWPGTDFGGTSLATQPSLQHNDSTKKMIMPHQNNDTITCNGTPHTVPGPAGGLLIHDIGIAGMGSIAAPLDIGIEVDGGSMVSEIAGTGNGFAGQAILELGTQNFLFRMGYPAAQLKGCQAFVSGVSPISDSVTPGICTTVEMFSQDSEQDFTYATDGAQFNTGHAAGPCYPNCGAIAVGNNADASFLFAQVSDIDYLIGGSNIRGKNWRADGTSREGVRFLATSGGDLIDGIMITGPCTDTALQAAYNAGTPTGCYGVLDLGQVNVITSVNSGGAAGVFGPTFQECTIADFVSGAAPSPNVYGFIPGKGDPNNITQNDKFYCGLSQGDASSARAVFPTMAPLSVTGASANVSGITSISLATTTPLTTIQGAIAGQWLLVYGIAGSSLGVSGNIHTCTGLAESPTNFPILLNNHGGYASVVGPTPNNVWQEVCNTPQNLYVHLNWTGNPIPTDPAIVDFYGNETARQVPALSIGGSIQLHGPNAPSGQYCFEQESVYADGSDNVSSLGCTTVDLTAQTPGEIFVVNTPQAVANNLYLVSNTTTSGIATGKYPAPTGGFWDGPTTIAAGGDGTTPPSATQNTTGRIQQLFNGIKGPLTAPTGTCFSGYGGETVFSQDGHATFCPIGGGTWTTKY